MSDDIDFDDEGLDLSDYDDVEVDLIIFGARTCSICGVEKPCSREYFKVDNRAPGGLKHECRICDAAQKRAHYAAVGLTAEQRERKRDRERQRRRDRYLNDAEYRARCQEQNTKSKEKCRKRVGTL